MEAQADGTGEAPRSCRPGSGPAAYGLAADRGLYVRRVIVNTWSTWYRRKLRCGWPSARRSGHCPTGSAP